MQKHLASRTKDVNQKSTCLPASSWVSRAKLFFVAVGFQRGSSQDGGSKRSAGHSWNSEFRTWEQTISLQGFHYTKLWSCQWEGWVRAKKEYGILNNLSFFRRHHSSLTDCRILQKPLAPTVQFRYFWLHLYISWIDAQYITSSFQKHKSSRSKHCPSLWHISSCKELQDQT